MTEVMSLLARYNRHADNQLFALLEALPENRLDEDAGSFFGSIMGLLNHSLLSSINWLRRFRASPLPLPSLDTPVLDIDDPGFGNPLHEGLESLVEHQRAVDELFIALTGELTEPLLRTEVVYTDSSGRKLERIAWQALLHLFNHQTHHRGQISQILDERGIENDFSGLAAVL